MGKNSLEYYNSIPQEQKDAFIKKHREKQLKESLIKTDPKIMAEYSKKLNSKPFKYSLSYARNIFLDMLIKATKKTKEEIINNIGSEIDYSEACQILVDYCFTFENEKLKDKGGIFIWSEPGVGKTCLLLTCAYILASLRIVKGNYWKTHIWFNMTGDISKHNKGQHPDLTYYIDCSIMIDDFTEKINQANNYDYKYSLNEVIQNRYEKWRSNNYITLITSNIHPSTFDQFMDERSITRFNEQYLVLELLGKNKRNSN